MNTSLLNRKKISEIRLLLHLQEMSTHLFVPDFMRYKATSEKDYL